MCKILRNATNSDYFTKKEVNFPLAGNNTLALTMVGGGVFRRLTRSLSFKQSAA